MSKVKFCFGIHNHQPVGNFGWVIEDAFQKSYLPFLQLLEKNEFFRTSLHFTGILYDWLKLNQPQGLDLIGKLVERSQVELLTGAFFEPILPIIPGRDQVEQIKRQTSFIKSEFGVTPNGMWLAERVWEPQLPVWLSQAGVEYIILDDIHFRFAGVREGELNGYYITEDQGNKVAVFPISRRLRYTIPFADPEDTVEHLRQLADEFGASVGIYADDGEKFGVWPETNKHCYEDKWLERFLTEIESNLDWIEMTTFGEALAQTQPKGLIYLPTASYSEMNEWSLPAGAIAEYDNFVHQLKDAQMYDESVAFVKGGFWRNFLSKYPESNHLHKKMLSISHRLEQNREKIATEKYTQIQSHLFAGQCNCPYWHGVFGGLYLPHLRGAVMQELVIAEKLLQQESGKRAIEMIKTDFDCDGHDELVVRGDDGLAVVTPARGGKITELDYFPAAKNLVDIVGRRREAYHNRLLEKNAAAGKAKSIHDTVRVKEKGLEQLLAEDHYSRGLFIDHILAHDTETSDLQKNLQDEPLNLPLQDYRIDSTDQSEENLTIELSLDSGQVTLSKRMAFSSAVAQIRAEYKLRNGDSERLTGELAVEFGFGGFPFPAGESSLFVDTEVHLKLEELHDRPNSHTILLHSRLYDFGVMMTSSDAFRLHAYPLHTVSLSESGFEKVYQGIILLPAWQLRLEQEEEFSVSLQLSVFQGNEMKSLARLRNHVSQAAP